jgi:hypothetical protein
MISSVSVPETIRLFKRMFKIAHVFQLEMWITPKSLLFSGCILFLYRPIGKLTLQEFSLRILPVDSSTSATRRSPHRINRGSVTSFLRIQIYELI